MLLADLSNILVEQRAIASQYLRRLVIVDLYLPKNITAPNELNLLLINDGQDLEDMKYGLLLNGLIGSGQVEPVLCVGIHAGKHRLQEYGTVGIPDFAGRGARAGAYQSFITEELLPFIHQAYAVESFRQKGFCGFSLGGLSALDGAFFLPPYFSIAGVFSGSLWWRTRDLHDGYQDSVDRIIHQKFKKGRFVKGFRFYFTTGSLDETADRNNNGIIDSIDDTLDLISELEALGYQKEEDIRYINYEDGKHDVATWGRAMPAFLLWAWGREKVGS